MKQKLIEVLNRVIQIREVHRQDGCVFEAVCTGHSPGQCHIGVTIEEAVGSLVLAAHGSLGLHIAVLRCTEGIELPVGDFLEPVLRKAVAERQGYKGEKG